MIGQALAKKLRAGQRVYGTCTVVASTRMVGAITPAQPEFVFIDTEHNALDRTQVSWMCRTFTGLGIVPIVRIMSPDPYLAASTIDDGALGIVAPYIETVEQVDALRGAVKNRPLKGQRGPHVRVSWRREIRARRRTPLALLAPLPRHVLRASSWPARKAVAVPAPAGRVPGPKHRLRDWRARGVT